ncbi:hypothetical protein LAZ67_1004103 [Cordylochernes scorpioides]|uniref:Transposase n=1 Tax=Cordylochernes scorpioides TaxID=51811 RepID=A0ABY6JXK7_9ARAC|nr:hypothetical protein LAZ67_1004103 [Cordylochernes scorpioides]
MDNDQRTSRRNRGFIWIVSKNIDRGFVPKKCFITITPQHTELFPWEIFLTKNSMLTMPHPPYSPDLALNDFFLFPRMKSVLKGHRFDTVNAIKEKSLSVLRGITSDEYSGCFRNWEKRMKRCIDSLGQYFEEY